MEHCRGRLLSQQVTFHASRASVSGFESCPDPDDYTGYLEANFAHTLPAISYYGTTLWPSVLRGSYACARHKPINLMHQMRIYDPEKRKPDRVIGSILEVQMRHEGRESLSESPEDAHCIRALGCLFKQAHGVDRLMGQHLGGRHRWTVSMEINFWLDQGGFLIADPELRPEGTPQAMQRAGYSYVPIGMADDRLLGTYDMKNRRMSIRRESDGAFVGKYKGKDTYFVMGGLDGNVTFAGLGVVQFGAQREAEIARMLAGLDGDEEALAGMASGTLKEILSAMQIFVDSVNKV